MFREKEKPTYNDCNCTVSALSAGGPAENSRQILPGDVLAKVDGKSVAGLRLQDLGGLLLGPVGSAVALEFVRGPGWRDGQGKTYSVDLQRRWNTLGLKAAPVTPPPPPPTDTQRGRPAALWRLPAALQNCKTRRAVCAAGHSAT